MRCKREGRRYKDEEGNEEGRKCDSIRKDRNEMQKEEKIMIKVRKRGRGEGRKNV